MELFKNKGFSVWASGNLTSRKQCFRVLYYLVCHVIKELKKGYYPEYVIITDAYMPIPFVRIELNNERTEESHRKRAEVISK